MNFKVILRKILRHSGIYGIGQLLSRCVSVLMLPFYTAYLTPVDYGCIAILDLSSSILTILIGRGIVAAVNRYHFDSQDDLQRERVWWTGLTCLALVATVMVMLAWIWRDLISYAILGPTQSQGGYYVALVVGTLWFGSIAEIPNIYLRVRQWSGLSVVLSFTFLILNAGLNIYLLSVLGLGIAGVLLGNLIAAGLRMIVVSAIFVRNRGSYIVHWPLMRQFLRFGAPLLMTVLLSLVMHQADRYLLRMFIDLQAVGIYALAYSVGHAISSLYLVPFDGIWSVTIYELNKLPNAKDMYARIFQYFVYGLLLIMLGVSLFARPLFMLVATPAYAEAANLLPIICLAYVFFSLHSHFNVPVLLAKRTTMLLPASLAGAVTNIGVNLLFIPSFGTVAAAWCSVLTFAVYSFVGLWRYRSLERYPYPLVRCSTILIGMVASYVIYRISNVDALQYPWSLSIAGVIWIAWALLLFGPLLWMFMGKSPMSMAKNNPMLGKIY